MRKLRVLISMMIIAVLACLDAGAVFAVSGPALSAQGVEMERVFNCRDLGGYQAAGGKHVRRGLLIRSGELAYATDKDIRKMSKELGIRKIIDLRYYADRRYCPDKKVPGTAVLHIPIKQDRSGAVAKARRRYTRFTKLSLEPDTERFYGTFASTRRKVIRRNTNGLVNSRSSQKAYRTYFRHLLKNGKRQPILFHCIAGKDRTGIAACMTLLALGVDEKTAIREYCLTNDYYRAVHADRYGTYSYGVSEKDLRYALKNAKKKYGSMRNFLRKAYGLSDADIAKLRKVYLE